MFRRLTIGMMVIFAISTYSNFVSAQIKNELLVPSGQKTKVKSLENDRLAVARQWALETSNDLEVVGEAVVELPNLERPLYQFKLIDGNGDVQEVLLDDSGNSIPLDFVTSELVYDYQQRKKVHPALALEMELAQAADLIPVIIWCRVPDDIELPDRVDPENPVDMQLPSIDETPSLETALDGQDTVEVVTADSTTLVAKLIRENGFESSIQEDAPIIYAELSKDAILEISASHDVLEIYHDGINEQHMSTARRSVKAHIANARGLNGSGIKVGVVEVGGRIRSNHPFLNVYQYYPYSDFHDHASAVAGAVASRHGTHKGIAPNARLYLGGSARGQSSELIHILYNSRRWGANVINNSWGSYGTIPDANSRACDHLAFRFYKTITNSAGNSGQSSGQVGNPGLSYNCISVGATDNRGTGLPGDDRMAPYSSYRNPYSPRRDRQKPDLVAPGGNRFAGESYGLKSLSAFRNAFGDSTSAGPWLVNTQGTSFSSPIVAGGAALLMQRAPALKEWQESVKAILAVTATNNIEGWRSISDKDGAGSIMLNLADQTAARNGRAGWGGVRYDFSRPAVYDIRQVYFKRGERARVAIVWNQNPNYSLYSSRPCADLDLQIICPNGTVCTGAYSWDNTMEVVDFYPSVSGNYKIRVRRPRMDLSPKYLGYAWYQD